MLVQGIRGVPPISSGYNPATWMLEISTPAAEEKIGKDFATIYTNSDHFRYISLMLYQYSVCISYLFVFLVPLVLCTYFVIIWIFKAFVFFWLGRWKHLSSTSVLQLLAQKNCISLPLLHKAVYISFEPAYGNRPLYIGEPLHIMPWGYVLQHWVRSYLALCSGMLVLKGRSLCLF